MTSAHSDWLGSRQLLSTTVMTDVFDDETRSKSCPFSQVANQTAMVGRYRLSWRDKAACKHATTHQSTTHSNMDRAPVAILPSTSDACIWKGNCDEIGFTGVLESFFFRSGIILSCGGGSSAQHADGGECPWSRAHGAWWIGWSFNRSIGCSFGLVAVVWTLIIRQFSFSEQLMMALTTWTVIVSVFASASAECRAVIWQLIELMER